MPHLSDLGLGHLNKVPLSFSLRGSDASVAASCSSSSSGVGMPDQSVVMFSHDSSSELVVVSQFSSSSMSQSHFAIGEVGGRFGSVSGLFPLPPRRVAAPDLQVTISSSSSSRPLFVCQWSASCGAGDGTFVCVSQTSVSLPVPRRNSSSSILLPIARSSGRCWCLWVPP